MKRNTILSKIRSKNQENKGIKIVRYGEEDIITKIRYNKNRTMIKIVSNKKNELIANNLKNALININVMALIINEINEKEIQHSNENHIFVFINRNETNIFPKRYIYYLIDNIEIKDEGYEAIWDHSLYYLNKYKEFNKKIYFLPQPYSNPIYNNYYDSEYDILFIGRINERVNKILKLISKAYNIVIYEEVFNNDLIDAIKKTKIVLFININENNQYNGVIINEAIKLNKLIITEEFDSCLFLDNLFEDFMLFYEPIDRDLLNLLDLFDLLDYYLNPINYEEKIKENDYCKTKYHNKTKFYLQKAMLSVSNYECCTLNYDLKKDTIYCISLVETPYRLTEFVKQNIDPKLTLYPAIKFPVGWIGCCMSYQNLIYNAKRLNLENITICEDDCKFTNDHIKKYDIIKEFLSKVEWDVFAGCVGMVKPETNIKNIWEYKGIQFVEIDFFTSMVFNIYNNTCYDKVIEWDTYNNISWDRDNIKKTTHTIDLYMSNLKLRTITTIPFLVECINIKSTLWNGSGDYKSVFSGSIKKLNEKIIKSKLKIQKIN